MARTRIGVIGLGMAVAPHAKSLAELGDRVEVAACYSPTEARRIAFAGDYGLPVSGELDAIFADRTIDAVMILTPPNTHLNLGRRAASAGKHILLEKPLEISIQRSEALVEAAEQAGVTLGVVLQHRFRQAAETCAGLIVEGQFGALVGASARINNWRPQSYYDQPGRGAKTRDGGGVLLTQGIHTLDLMISLAGLPVEVSAYAATSPLHRMETEDIAAAAMRFANGAIGAISATTCAYPGYADEIEIIGERGVARLCGTELSARFHDERRVEVGDNAAGTGSGADPMAFSHQHHRAVLADFLDAIEQGRQPRISGREALKVHDFIGAILESAEAGAPVRVRQRDGAE